MEIRGTDELDIKNVLKYGQFYASALVLQGELQSLVDYKVSLHQTLKTHLNNANTLLSDFLIYKFADAEALNILSSLTTKQFYFLDADDTVRRYWMQKLRGRRKSEVSAFLTSLCFVCRPNMNEQTSDRLGKAMELFTPTSHQESRGGSGGVLGSLGRTHSGNEIPSCYGVSGTDPIHWEEMIDKVPQVMGSEAKEAAIHILKFSIWSLPPVYKACLLYLFCFSCDLELPVRKLLHLWLGEGFFTGLSMEWKMQPEYLAELCLKDLVNRELIKVTSWKFDGSPKRCRLSDLVYNLSTQEDRDIFKKSIFKVMAASSSDLSSYERYPRKTEKDIKTVRSCICLTKSFPKSLTTATSDVDIKKCFDEVERQHHFGLVRVLDLEGVYKPLLPNLAKLLLLRYLCLRSTAITSIPPEVGDLPLLETLDLKQTSVSTLPPSIWESKSLRGLYVNDVRVDHRQKTSPGALTNLHTVSGLYIAQSEVITNIFDGCSNVKKLGFTCHRESIDAVLNWVLKDLQNPIESLKIRCVDGDGKSSEIKLRSLTKHQHLHKLYLLGKLEDVNSDNLVKIEKPLLLSGLLPSCLTKLTLSMSNLRDDPMPVLGESFPELTILRLLADSYTGTRLTCSNRLWFPKLRCLKLWKLAQLKELTVQEGGMSLLQVLELRMCGSMEKLNGIEHLPGSNEVILTNMPNNFVMDICAMKVGTKTTVQNLKSTYYQVSEFLSSRCCHSFISVD